MKIVRQSLIVSPIGPIPEEILAAVCRGAGETFRLPTEVLRLLDDIDFSFSVERRQYHSTPILDRLSQSLPQNGLKVLAVTEVDLFIPILTHVYGEAQLGGTAAIVSTHRLCQSSRHALIPQTGIDRIVKEAVHELGHTFNLRHCPESGCPMHYCRSEADVDLKSVVLCRYCRVLLDDAVRGGQRVEG